MQQNIQIGDWNFEPICIRGRKVSTYGDSYTAIGTITITDGEPHIEGLLSTDKLTASDKESLHTYISMLGYDYYITSRFIEGKRKNEKIYI